MSDAENDAEVFAAAVRQTDSDRRRYAAQRDQAIARMRGEGSTLSSIAKATDLTVQAVAYILARQKKENGMAATGGLPCPTMSDPDRTRNEPPL